MITFPHESNLAPNILENTPDNVLVNTLSHLPPEGIIRIKEVSRGLNARLDSSRFDLFWRPILDRLSAMDSQIVSTHDLNDTISKHLKISFMQINNRQLEEIAHFIKWIQGGKITLPNLMTRHLLSINHSASRLETLEDKHLFLNKVNAHLIVRAIQHSPSDKILNISRFRLTRFPQELFENANLQEYWTSLKGLYCAKNKFQDLPQALGNCRELRIIDCSQNLLRTLPEALGNCVALEHLICTANKLRSLPYSLGNCIMLGYLYCNNNSLETLPASLGKCTLLTGISCHHNQLQTLPTSLGNCKVLRWIKCNHNQLRILPDTLGNCLSLTGLHCGNNQLQDIPDTLSHCVALKSLRCEGNQLLTLPAAIWRKFGLEDCRAMLAKQSIHWFTRLKSYLPSYLALNSRAENDRQSNMDNKPDRNKEEKPTPPENKRPKS